MSILEQALAIPADQIQAEGYGTISDHDPTLGLWDTIENLVTQHSHSAGSISKGNVNVRDSVNFQQLFLAISKISPYIALEFMRAWLNGTKENGAKRVQGIKFRDCRSNKNLKIVERFYRRSAMVDCSLRTAGLSDSASVLNEKPSHKVKRTL